ncbi:MFS transporter [Thiothrix fructosivorans]|uniref:MFS transporter n=1 Tax=Thiothrix fructosivorans TaxID=111770 RepID=A0A8B0SGJ2_9GAMM|nr:MFS transporter [Thiothrix fructosivorans]MBO0615178.1 MFS transporter [Thiothrix fructosivorans]QTX09965.1 MFS transporter [Thiothrix fructosivorans]
MSTAHYRQWLFYGLPGLPLAMLGLPLYVYLPSFYAQDLGLSLSVVGMALLAARGLDVLTDPLIGWLNDKVQSTWGRRKLFMLLGLPLLLVGLEYLLRPSGNVDGVYLFAWSFVTYLGWTFISIPWQAWGAEMTRDYHGKSALAASREGFGIVGTVVVISLPLLTGASQAAITLGTLANLLWWLLPLSLIPALVWLVERRQARRFASLRKVGSILSAHPAIRQLLPAYFINSLANALPATLFILFVTHVLQAPEQVGVVLLVYFLSGVLGLPLWLWLARHLDKSRAWASALLLSVVGFAFVPLLGAGDTAWFMAICVISGLALGADVALPASMQADIAQQMQHQGNPNTGLLFGLWGLLTKLALALAVGLAFPLLDWAGFAPAATTQTSTTLWSMVLLYAGLPVLLKSWVIWRMWQFPFSEVDFRDYWEMSYASALYPANPSAPRERVQQHED